MDAARAWQAYADTIEIALAHPHDVVAAEQAGQAWQIAEAAHAQSLRPESAERAYAAQERLIGSTDAAAIVASVRAVARAHAEAGE